MLTQSPVREELEAVLALVMRAVTLLLVLIDVFLDHELAAVVASNLLFARSLAL